jgi:hypothetical protein
MAGEYRKKEVLDKLPADLAVMIRRGLRIGLTGQPMTGVRRIEELSDKLADAFEAAGEDHYAEGLRSGAMVPLVPAATGGKTWAPGELFFTS